MPVLYVDKRSYIKIKRGRAEFDHGRDFDNSGYRRRNVIENKFSEAIEAKTTSQEHMSSGPSPCSPPCLLRAQTMLLLGPCCSKVSFLQIALCTLHISRGWLYELTFFTYFFNPPPVHLLKA